MELYIHIPFCVRKCAYCDFLSAPADQDTIAQYMMALEKQLVRQAASFRNKVIDTVFIGETAKVAINAFGFAKRNMNVQSEFVAIHRRF